eukprot:scaffold101463_cov75-Phaeocystis_antarctica.AAC.4
MHTREAKLHNAARRCPSHHGRVALCDLATEITEGREVCRQWLQQRVGEGTRQVNDAACGREAAEAFEACARECTWPEDCGAEGQRPQLGEAE